MNDKKIHNRVTAVDRATDIIEFVASCGEEITLSHILTNLDIPSQSLIRPLNTLFDRGFLNLSGKRGLYPLGLGFPYPGYRLHDKFYLRIIAWKHLKELTQERHKTIKLSTLDKAQFILEQIPGSEDFHKINSSEG